MREFIELEIGAVKVMLLAEKAMYWPERELLFIADIHFGKAAAYRTLGQPVPAGTTMKNLQRLDVLLNKYPIKAIIFLGDFLHAPESHAPSTIDVIHKWRKAHPETACILIRGNHDKRAGDPPTKLQIEVVNEPFILDALAFQHSPVTLENYHVVAGHSHPSFQLRGRGHQKITMPCFHHTAGLIVLPSFGEFTGGHPIEVLSDSRVFVTDGSGIWEPNIKKLS